MSPHYNQQGTAIIAIVGNDGVTELKKEEEEEEVGTEEDGLPGGLDVRGESKGS